MFFGGNAAGLDYMSYLSFGNVEVGHPWLYYVHACFVWFVVLTVQINVYAAQTKFLKLRYEWLKGLPELRSTTLLVETIPEKHRSDANLKKFFENMMGAGSVNACNVVKDTTELYKRVQQKDALQLQLEEVGDDRSKVPQLEADIKQANEDIVALRTAVRAQATKTVDNADGEKVQIGRAHV